MIIPKYERLITAWIVVVFVPLISAVDISQKICSKNGHSINITQPITLSLEINTPPLNFSVYHTCKLAVGMSGGGIVHWEYKKHVISGYCPPTLVLKKTASENNTLRCQLFMKVPVKGTFNTDTVFLEIRKESWNDGELHAYLVFGGSRANIHSMPFGFTLMAAVLSYSIVVLNSPSAFSATEWL